MGILGMEFDSVPPLARVFLPTVLANIGRSAALCLCCLVLCFGRALLTQLFSITNTHPLVKNVKNCIKCFRFHTKIPFQFMAVLPRERVIPYSPIVESILLDHSVSNPKKQKYINIYMHEHKGAVHKIVSGLSKTDFMLGLECFIARRGLLAKIGSDNGIFVGSRNDRFRITALFDKDKIGSKANCYCHRI